MLQMSEKDVEEKNLISQEKLDRKDPEWLVRFKDKLILRRSETSSLNPIGRKARNEGRDRRSFFKKQ